MSRKKKAKSMPTPFGDIVARSLETKGFAAYWQRARLEDEIYNMSPSQSAAVRRMCERAWHAAKRKP